MELLTYRPHFTGSLVGTHTHTHMWVYLCMCVCVCVSGCLKNWSKNYSPEARFTDIICVCVCVFFEKTIIQEKIIKFWPEICFLVMSIIKKFLTYIFLLKNNNFLKIYYTTVSLLNHHHFKL